VLRIVAVILFFAMPITLLGYIAAVLLLPSKPGTRSRRHQCRRDKRRARREARKAEAQASAAPRFTAADVERQAAALEKRLARIEKYVTSSRYDLDREFRYL
ncbi:MAG: hypothetical protein KJO82_00710, partial [Gammaproteobacteria bacterium]|nr:hypothetical protein [Gammaproteobacteria bacterium]